MTGDFQTYDCGFSSNLVHGQLGKDPIWASGIECIPKDDPRLEEKQKEQLLALTKESKNDFKDPKLQIAQESTALLEENISAEE